MKIVIAPDSYKGTMKASEVADIIETGVLDVYPLAQISKIPFSDGGEGSAECFHSAIGGDMVQVSVKDPLGREVSADYLYKEEMAIIESAQACGLPLLSEEERNPKLTTTYGVGQLILNALNKGAKKIVLTLGGSSTNDGGVGMVAALGVKFIDKLGNFFIPVGETLRDIMGIDFSGIDKRVYSSEIIGMCDVKNTICGEFGASYVYAPQKGATPEDVLILEEGLCHLTNLLSKIYNTDYFSFEGGGAAGGLGLAVAAFLKGKLVSGIELMMKIAEFDKKTANSDLLITGEGRLDRQSFMGKVIEGMSKKAIEHHLPLIIISGSITPEVTEDILKKHGVFIAESTDLTGKPFKEIKHRARLDLALASIRVMQKYKELTEK